jgi:hypothetical protein
LQGKGENQTLERKIAIISIVIGVVWFVSCIAALVFGLTFVGGVENNLLSPLNLVINTTDKVYNDIVGFEILGIKIGKVAEIVVAPIKDVIKKPMEDLKHRIESVFTTIKLAYAGVIVWLALPQILLIYTGWLLRKGRLRGRK